MASHTRVIEWPDIDPSARRRNAGGMTARCAQRLMSGKIAAWQDRITAPRSRCWTLHAYPEGGLPRYSRVTRWAVTAPAAWRVWVGTGMYHPLMASPTVIVRTREQQLPTAGDMLLLEAVYRHFASRPYDFEQFAAEMWPINEPHVDRIDVTRPWRDGSVFTGLPLDG
jgi:hypothetical protein